MKTIFGIFLLIVIYLSIYFSLTILNFWILLSTFSVVHIGLFQTFRENLNFRFYIFTTILHLFMIFCLNLYFKQTN
ncbi:MULTISPECIES: hypothetical protein [Leptospira]|uniref:Uncharacterized protein n=3 Tax=Leptospira kirschneri TaxID=29507 RepID=A0A1T1E0S1_9LEPT|nr:MULTISPECIES: hypothetical protein [Leptospira]EKO17572.1 hypothetical protein LEP1GSC081_0612 [Leptospira kirschneri str. H1]EMK03467.1 hypothetical protein LEP1GSC166_0422 [Leptospira kirschneri]EMK25067.1 hypothetical protein LEP1GSC008_1530 [Leptospira kirschneri serovar Bulgarica str. Nikolaevo]OOV46691.1 hypothetical protein B1J93_03470 [Leptospira kirschneri serovar Pomona]UML81302.1 hypothetical protein FH602_06655 [Leptospira kirschneri]